MARPPGGFLDDWGLLTPEWRRCIVETFYMHLDRIIRRYDDLPVNKAKIVFEWLRAIPVVDWQLAHRLHQEGRSRPRRRS